MQMNNVIQRTWLVLFDWHLIGNYIKFISNYGAKLFEYNGKQEHK